MSNRTDIVVETDNAEGQVLLSASRVYDLTEDKTQDTINSEVKNTISHKADVIYDTASGDIASFPDGADGLPVKDLTVGIEPVQSGTGDPSPTNVRPISGWTGCNVSRTGVNVWDEEYKTGTYNTGAAVFEPNNTHLACKNPISVKPNTDYFYQTNGYNINVCYLDAEQNCIGNFNSVADVIRKTPNDCHHIVFNMAMAYGTTYNHDISINYQSTDHDYHAYTGETIPISWQSEAGTVYGGTLDATTGVLTVRWKYKRYTGASGEDWRYSEWTMTETAAFYENNGLPDGTGHADYYNCIKLSNMFHVLNKTYFHDNDVAGITITGGYARLPSIRIPKSDLSTVDAAGLMAYLANNPLDILYELANPLKYTLDSVTLSTLLGQNNVWTDCGPSTVEYPADTKLYIQKINTPTDDDMIADANIASGKYFIVGNNLYLSTAAILAGDPIKPGTNCTATNLAAALNAINS